jgi:FeS assembly SUF system regulator
MLQINKLTDYATIILSFLAGKPDTMTSATQIAQQTHLAIPTVSKLLKILAEYELVRSFRGVAGGYQLARLAKDITLADVLAAVEGRLAITECCTASLCTLDSLCAVKENWQLINKKIVAALASVTIHDMMRPLAGARHVIALRGIPIMVEQHG